ncbi:hypothetical protein WICPIJ_008814 [Wickerhamomyces pijperi]|uniref:VWFA domain-containing protein n=1 Tax=Wickerhamomyces pijperi TaxID=599730 RepID=A0A9P8PUX8_WICPI|nr:hypothetical protein WICPIJ_008814 [Wickerhamomyces pijperi]
MVLEATMIVIDNSEFTRNGDYPTNRFEAQMDAVDLIFQAKVNSNPENTVGLLAAGGNGPQVLSTLTADYGKLLGGIHETKIHGDLHFATGIQVAALALKHRQNKVQHQRIISFVGSPIQESEKELEKLAKKMKKNNIAIDFINYGEESLNTAKLEKFISIINSHDNSHLVTVPPSHRLLHEVIASSPIVLGEDDFGGNAGQAGGFGNDDFGFGDPNMDPDLALALRLSLEEETARQARETQAREEQAEPLQTVAEEAPTGDANNQDEDTEMKDSN